MEHAPVVNSQSRVFQNDSKCSKSEFQGTSDSRQITLTNQKRNLSHVQSTCSSKTPRTQLPSLRSAAEAKPTNIYIYIYIYMYIYINNNYPNEAIYIYIHIYIYNMYKMAA